ncbi:hypothetical protein [Litorisediminicola beolgyonensis]|uniref:Uncharacterized protein n=1 Tax=Litorisediminicola beolgyonensis TaxID=1173614 RepID=A0ABW3ZN05_9RHOB
MKPLLFSVAYAVTALAGAASALAPPLSPTLTIDLLPPLAELDGLTEVEVDAIIDRLNGTDDVGDRHARLDAPAHSLR